MSLIDLFSIGRSALNASQFGLAVTGDNVANINTPDYARQEVVLSISTPVTGAGGNLIGTGVAVLGVRRNYDRFIAAQIVGQQQLTGRSTALDRMLSQVEQVFNETQGSGLMQPLAEFFNAWQDVAGNPSGQAERIVLLQKAGSLVMTAQRMETSLLGIMKQAPQGVVDMTAQVNSLAAGIASLNGKIMQFETGSALETAGQLRTQRDGLLHQLADLTDISYYENSDGSLNVSMGMRNLVSGTRANSLTATTNADGSVTLSLDTIDITDRIVKGRMGGMLAARNDLANNPLTDLRRLVASVVQSVNSLHRGGFGLDSLPGGDFFTGLTLAAQGQSAAAAVTSAVVTNESALTLDAYSMVIDAANNYTVTNTATGATAASGAYVSGAAIAFDGMSVTITGAAAAGDTFTVSPLDAAISGAGVAISDLNRIAASSAIAGLPGNNDNALAIASLASAGIASIGGVSYFEKYGAMVAYAGTSAAIAVNSLEFDRNTLQSLKEKQESIAGVSLDEEAANIIRFQRAFEASARLISVADELMQTIIQL